MQKKTENVIAVINALTGRQSQQKLPRKDLRLLIHNAVERYTAKAIKEREDWWTHIDDATLAYTVGENYWSFELPNTVVEFMPINIYFQPTTSDRDTGDWYEAKLVSLDSFSSESRLSRVVVAFYGNNYDTIGSLRCLINITEGYAGEMRWRVQYRRTTNAPPVIGGNVPFPFDYIQLIEYAVAEEALTMIDDDSENFMAYLSRRLPF